LNIDLRLEEENDFRTVENLTREAFWNVYKPGCTNPVVMNISFFIICEIPPISSQDWIS